MSSSLSNLLTAAEENTRERPLPAQAFGAIAFVGFMLLLGVLWSFRGTAQKISGQHLPHDHSGGSH